MESQRNLVIGGNWDAIDYVNGKRVYAEVIWDKDVPNEEKSFEDKKVDELSAVSWRYDNINFSNLKWLSTEKYGNICIPSNWEVDTDVQAISDNVIMYGLSDASQTVIIKDCSASSANSEIQSLLTKLANDVKLEEWSYEAKTIDGRNAVIVNAKFNTINHVQSTMFIASPDQSRMIVVCIEAANPDVKKLLDTYTYEKNDEEATAYFEASTK